jgi:hypothetical protein
MDAYVYYSDRLDQFIVVDRDYGEYIKTMDPAHGIFILTRICEL